MPRDEFDPERPGVQAALHALEDAIGGRQALVDALSVSDDPDLDYLIGLIADPRSEDTPIGKLCDQGGVTPQQLLKAYRSGRLARKQVEAIHRITDQLPDVAGDVMRRALNHDRICAACHGTGRGERPESAAPDAPPTHCPDCEGTGKTRVDASLEHQKLALELAGLLTKGGGTNVNVGVNVASAPALLPFGKLQQAVQQVLQAAPVPKDLPSPVPQIVEGEVQ